MTTNPMRKYWKDQPVTPEDIFLNRRQFIAKLGLAAGSIGLSAYGQEASAEFDLEKTIPAHPASDGLFPAKKNEKYLAEKYSPPLRLTDRKVSLTYNNYYEFGDKKRQPAKNVGAFEPFPWSIDFTGLCNKPGSVDIEDIFKKVAFEERVYRFRCVEAWAAVVPWTGFPLSELLKMADPKNEAKFVSFTSMNRPDQAPGILSLSYYNWPYVEALRMDEAMNPLAFVGTGSYGKRLAKQQGSPIRLVLPWKYGFKGAKSIVKIEFLDKQPHTFWNDAAPKEYGFIANINPDKPHPRWSQATERIVDDADGKRQPTLLYNGYTDEVAKLYTGDEY